VRSATTTTEVRGGMYVLSLTSTPAGVSCGFRRREHGTSRAALLLARDDRHQATHPTTLLGLAKRLWIGWGRWSVASGPLANRAALSNELLRATDVKARNHRTREGGVMRRSHRCWICRKLVRGTWPAGVQEHADLVSDRSTHRRAARSADGVNALLWNVRS
jgi:hypothetical protein